MAGGKDIWSDPKQAAGAGWVLVALLTFLAALLQSALDFDGVLDIDVINFGLAAYDFDVLAHQPHPPGYPGYVVYLKIIHVVAPGLDPIEVAKWGSRLCGLALVPSLYWTCRRLLGRDEAAPVGRPLVAAGLAVLHPILWYYGGDGQSHSAEALITVLLFGAAVSLKSHRRAWGRIVWFALLGLSGSVRPTAAFLLSPVAVWLLWRRPWRDWSLAAATGAVAVALWYVPLVALTGGIDLYSRATKALVGDLFVANFSVLGTRATAASIATNLLATAASAGLAAMPLIAIGRQRRPWLRPLLLFVAANIVFYGLLFTAEVGYFASVAALACLTPGTWSSPVPRASKIATAAVAVFGCAFVAAAPAEMPVPGSIIGAPSLSHVVRTAQSYEHHGRLMCGAANGKRTLLLTDNPILAHNRWLPLHCGEIVVAVHLHDVPYNPDLNVGLLFTKRTMKSLPGPVPLEPGPPGQLELQAIELVILAPDASSPWRRAITDQARCDPDVVESGIADSPLSVWPRQCLDQIAFGPHRLSLSP